MKRVVGHFVTIVSLLIAVGSCVFWVRSHWYVDEFGLGSWKDRAHLTLRMNTAYTIKGSILFKSEKLRFFDEARSPNSVRSYFGHNFWQIQWAENVVDGAYIDPASRDDVIRAVPAFLGIGFRRDPVHVMGGGDAEVSGTTLLVPLWLVTVLAMFAPVYWLLKRIRRRTSPGHCRTCNYDLRAHGSGGKCPECGGLIA